MFNSTKKVLPPYDQEVVVAYNSGAWFKGKRIKFDGGDVWVIEGQQPWSEVSTLWSYDLPQPDYWMSVDFVGFQKQQLERLIA